MIWEDDANTSYRKGEKIRIDLYAKSTDGGADRLVKSQEVTPIEKTVYILSIMLRKFSKMLMVAILILRVKITEPWTAASFGTAVKHSPIF